MTLDDTIVAYSSQWPYAQYGGARMAELLTECEAELRPYDFYFSTSHTTLWIIRRSERRKTIPSQWIGAFTDGSDIEIWLARRDLEQTIDDYRETHSSLDAAAQSLVNLAATLVS